MQRNNDSNSDSPPPSTSLQQPSAASYSASTCISLATALISDLLHSKDSVRSRFNRQERERSRTPAVEFSGDNRNCRPFSSHSSEEEHQTMSGVEALSQDGEVSDEDGGDFPINDHNLDEERHRSLYPDLREACALCGSSADCSGAAESKPESELVVRCCRKPCQR